MIIISQLNILSPNPNPTYPNAFVFKIKVISFSFTLKLKVMFLFIITVEKGSSNLISAEFLVICYFVRFINPMKMNRTIQLMEFILIFIL
jgi:hypothetical protein